MIRLLVYTNEPVVVAGLKLILGENQNYRIVRFAETLEALIEAAESDENDLVLLDLTAEVTLPKIAELRRRLPSSNVVLWVQSISMELAHQMKELGIRGILRKDLPTSLMLRCIDKVAEGELWFDRSLLTSMLEAKRVNLSPRERQLLALLSQGLSNKQIASELFIAEGTVKVYFSKLFRKMGVNDRFELALYALRNVSDESGVVAGGSAANALAYPRSLIIQTHDRRH
jgi:DNA-binding NarL/FixJ family response regulator